MHHLGKFTCRSICIIGMVFASIFLIAQNAPFHGGFEKGDTEIFSSLLVCNISCIKEYLAMEIPVQPTL
jgi:hypothetical protein